jgi:hypothetical protein
MMKKLLIIPSLLIGLSLLAQANNASQDEGPQTIRSSFDKMISKSNRYQDFKVVKITALNTFIAEVQDSLDVNQKKYNKEVNAKKQLIAQVETLNDTIAAKDSQVASLISQRDNINTAGMSMDKNSFSTAMWLALITLIGLLVALFLRNKSIAISQKNIRNNLSEVEGELASVKKKALEREQELKREVQDYVNKIEAMGPPR